MFFPVDYGEVNLCFSVNDLREYVPFCSGFIMFTCNHCDHLSFAFVCFFFYKNSYSTVELLHVHVTN